MRIWWSTVAKPIIDPGESPREFARHIRRQQTELEKLQQRKMPIAAFNKAVFFGSGATRQITQEFQGTGSSLDPYLISVSLISSAESINDWNLATGNGFYVNVAGALNAPDSSLRFMGIVVGETDLIGTFAVQTVWQFEEPTIARPAPKFERRLTKVGASMVWTPWRRIGPIGEITAATTDALGEITVPHGLGYAPLVILYGPESQNGLVSVQTKTGSITASAFTVTCRDKSGGLMASTAVRFHWSASA